MANEKVPWTTPGGTPCCCDPCPTTEDGPDATYSPGTWSNIIEADYNALLAEGTFTLDLSLSLEGTSSDGLGFVENAVANHVDIPLVTREAVLGSQPCYNQLIPDDVTINSTHTITNPDGTVSNPVLRPIIVNFTYALAIVGGTPRLSLANAKNSAGAGQDRYTAIIGSIVGIDLPLQTLITVSDPEYTDPLPETNSVIASVSLVMPNATYSADNVVRVLYQYESGFDGSVSGTFNMTVRYSPSAP